MAQMSRRFNFDDFDEQCRDGIEEAERTALDAKLCIEGIENEIRAHWGADEPAATRRPGEIGGVICTPLYKEWFGDEPEPPLPPEAA